MAVLRVQSFRGLVRGMAQAMQGAANRTLDFTTGSTARAWLEAVAGVGLWLQWLILELVRQTRAGTCIGSELDSWMADYGMTRLPAVAASGEVVLSRNAAGQAAFIPEGATIKTGDGTLVFFVTADPTHPRWQSDPRGYLLPAAATSLSAPVRCATPGATGNVSAGTITLLTTPLAGLDAATNPLGFANGVNAESDDALRSRFRLYIASLSRGTAGAVAYAVDSVRQGLVWRVAENVDAAGAPRPGNFVVTVDDGTGDPAPALLAEVARAIEGVRALSTTFSVRGPTEIPAAISLAISVSGDADKAGVIGAVARAITEHAQGLGVGEVLSHGKLFAVAYGADPSVSYVAGLTVNGGTADIGGDPAGVVRLASLSVV